MCSQRFVLGLDWLQKTGTVRLMFCDILLLCLVKCVFFWECSLDVENLVREKQWTRNGFEWSTVLVFSYILLTFQWFWEHTFAHIKLLFQIWSCSDNMKFVNLRFSEIYNLQKNSLEDLMFADCLRTLMGTNLDLNCLTLFQNNRILFPISTIF